MALYTGDTPANGLYIQDGTELREIAGAGSGGEVWTAEVLIHNNSAYETFGGAPGIVTLNSFGNVQVLWSGVDLPSSGLVDYVLVEKVGPLANNNFVALQQDWDLICVYRVYSENLYSGGQASAYPVFNFQYNSKEYIQLKIESNSGGGKFSWSYGRADALLFFADLRIEE